MLNTYTLASTPRRMKNTVTWFVFDYKTGSSQDLHTTTVQTQLDKVNIYCQRTL